MPKYFMTVNKKRHEISETDYLKAKNTRYSNTTFEVIEDDPDLRNITADELIKSHEEMSKPITKEEWDAYYENERLNKIATPKPTPEAPKKRKPKK